MNQEVEIEGQKITTQSVRTIQEYAELAQGNSKTGHAVEIGNAKNFNDFIVCEGQEETTAV